MKNITLLGATGSIGDSTLSVASQHRDKFNIFALSAHTNWQKMLNLCHQHQPKFAVMTDANAAEQLQANLNSDTQVLSGEAVLDQIASDKETDYVMAAIVGSAGMSSALAAAKAGKRIMLANKESLVCAGELFINTVKNSKAELIPVDSEHSAIFQCLQGNSSGLDKVQLTASGGPFLHTPLEQLKSITPDEACAHPNWNMGRKISVDSATMMNKGLEVIEAHYLFDLAPDQIDVIMHPQSIVHSSVYFKDGATLSQLGNPDMRSVISYAMAYPNRIRAGVDALDLSKNTPLEFYAPDFEKFTCLKLAYEALKQGGNAMGTVNAANEVAVDAFLNHKIQFLQIPNIIEKTLESISYQTLTTLDEITNNDQNARKIASELVMLHA